MIADPVVVLGGGGFIGSHLVARLVAGGHQVAAADVTFPHWRHDLLKGATCLRGSLLDPGWARIAVAGAATVFHLAADMGGVGYFHSDADLGASMRNGRITLNVLEAAKFSADTPGIVYAASACAYGVEAAGQLLTEDMLGIGTPDQLYGADKLHGLRLCSKVPGARVVVLDTVYGPGAEHEGPRVKFPAAVAAKALRARVTGELELWGDGTQVRCFLYVDDAVERILAVAGAERYDGPVNIGSQHPVDCREVAAMCLDLAGAKATITTDPSKPSGVSTRRLAIARYIAMFGVPTETPIEDGFGRLMEWLDR